MAVSSPARDLDIACCRSVVNVAIPQRRGSELPMNAKRLGGLNRSSQEWPTTGRRADAPPAPRERPWSRHRDYMRALWITLTLDVNPRWVSLPICPQRNRFGAPHRIAELGSDPGGRDAMPAIAEAGTGSDGAVMVERHYFGLASEIVSRSPTGCRSAKLGLGLLRSQ